MNKMPLIFAIAAQAIANADTLPAPCPSAATLADYIAMTSCTIEDKVFSNFDYSSAAQGGATAIIASGIAVTPIWALNDPGLEFTANWAAISGQMNDSTIGFSVATLDGAALIEDASVVQLSGAIIGTGTASVGEGLCVGANCVDTTYMLSTLNTADQTLIHLGDHVLFSPTGVVRATKDIGVAGGANGFGSVSAISDQFSEIPKVPEPASIAMLGTVLLSCVVVIRRRRA